MGMSSNDEIVDLEDTVNRMILLKVRNVPIRQRVLDRLEQSDRLLT